MRSTLALFLFGVLAIAAVGVVIAATRGPSRDEKTLYSRLGGVYPIAGVIDAFSDNLFTNPIVGVDSENPALREWHQTRGPDRLPGLKFMRTLWVADAAGGPFRFRPSAQDGDTKCPFSGRASGRLGLRQAHLPLQISSDEFDAVAGELAAALDQFQVPEQEKGEVLGVFAAHKSSVVSA